MKILVVDVLYSSLPSSNCFRELRKSTILMFYLLLVLLQLCFCWTLPSLLPNGGERFRFAGASNNSSINTNPSILSAPLVPQEKLLAVAVPSVVCINNVLLFFRVSPIRPLLLRVVDT